jgi:hypothetical protein
VVEQPYRADVLPADVLEVASRRVTISADHLFGPLDRSIVVQLDWADREAAFVVAAQLPAKALTATETASQLDGFSFLDSRSAAPLACVLPNRRSPMLFSLLYFLVCRLLGAGGRRPDERDIELLVLRHQMKVLQRQVKRPRLNRLDRVLLAAASRRLPRSGWSAFLVRPETLLRWHRELVRRKWTYRRMGHPGRPPVDADVRDLVVRLGRENPRCGYQRIRGELLKLGIRISATTVRTILLRSGLNPAPRRAGPTWTEFRRSSGTALGCARR